MTGNMTMQTHRFATTFAVLAAVGLLAAWAAGPAPARGDEEPAGAVGAEAVPPAPGEAEAYDLEDAIKSLSPEELNEVLSRALAARLAYERDSVAAEIRTDVLYEPDARDAAIKLLTDAPANTQEDNIERICRAFARVDEDFASAYKPFKAGQYAEALKKTAATLDVRESTYLSAALHYIQAEALIASDRHYDAIETYGMILKSMPDRVSFASTAALRSAEAYEAMNRLYYAAELYAYCLQNYGLTMSDEQLDKVVKRLEYLQGIYKDPIGSVAKRMGEVKTRLESIDSGKQTQEKQKEIVALLEDLIKTAEEMQQQSQSSQNQQSGQQSGQQKGQQPGQQQGDAQARATGNRAQGRPTNPAERSFLPVGPVRRPGDLGPLTPSTGADDWAKLPPEKRREIEEALRKLFPRTYQQLLRDYRIHLSQSRPGGTP